MRIPDDYIYQDNTVMSNFDRQINQKVAKELEDNKLYADYPGLNFFGNVWLSENEWACEIWVYNSYRETITANSLENLMKTVSDKYGWD